MAQRPPAVWKAPPKSPATAPTKINVSRLSFKLALRHYHDSAEFRAVIQRDFGGMQELTTATNTCALRVSYALWKSGKDLNGVSARRMVTTRNSLSLPSVAEDYVDILENGTELKKHARLKLNHLRGIVLFKGGMADATGHITFFRSTNCIYTEDNKYFSYEGTTIWYWTMEP